MLVLSAENPRIFRITHIKNVPWILANGLHCRSSGILDPNFVAIGNPDLIEKRKERLVLAAPGGTLSDYIPFYFTPWSPMLYNIKTGYNGITPRAMEEIVIFGCSLRTLADAGRQFVFTDRHAKLETARFSTDLTKLSRLDWERLRARDFRRDPEDPGKMERYQAEALIHRHLPVAALGGIICYGSAQKAHLTALVEAAGHSTKVLVRPDYYF